MVKLEMADTSKVEKPTENESNPKSEPLSEKAQNRQAQQGLSQSAILKLQMADTSNIEKPTEDEKNQKSEPFSENVQENEPKFLIKLSETISFEINKALLLLKVAVFCWFGAGAVVTPFLALFLKQRGLQLEDLSFIYMVLPVPQLLGPTVSGIIADKIGRSKPVLQANLFFTIVTTTSMIFMPQVTYCNNEAIQCNSWNINETTISHCNIKGNGSETFSCNFDCFLDRKLDTFCFEDYISSCNLSYKLDFPHEFPPRSGNISYTKKYEDCVKSNNTTATNEIHCQNHRVKDCNVTCEMNNSTGGEANCDNSAEKTQVFIVSFILLGMFHTFYSNCYRIMDVTSMTMIQTHNSDFGRVRFWSISGILVFSPLAGYIITLVTPPNALPKYETVFYIFGVMAVITMIIVWKLDVKTEPPSKGLFKKTLGLLKNPDVVAFFIAVLVIGTAWGFTKLFSNWYLEEELGAPSSLIGLIPAVNSLVGLPFLLTSKWFVKKIGSTKLLITAMLGYATWCVGYSFLQNPWWSLSCEILGIVNYHLLWVAVITHSHSVAPVGFVATVISVAGGIHFGIGKGTGSLMGGYVMSQYGGRLAYRFMAITCVVSAFFYGLYLYLRKRFTTKEFELEQLERDDTIDYELAEKFTPQIWY